MDDTKTFNGTDRYKILERMDKWLIENNASYYGSSAMQWTLHDDGTFSLKVHWSGNDTNK
ncbi:hypothetical protein EQG49_00175 [Periweissella cryptocerci]|uniref:Uncharacterized protein n=1 Tax=Periweissella cryptocerci TaxID=2506420 RepID=A0A4P6YQT2_9LACO|nr:hypothetical protein [Periweissella cryptocerci]QBO34970.1 hypothetical protein EQG49_00175 [Periweissella cryptocerci]